MHRLLAAICLILPPSVLAGPAADTARAVRESAFDRDQCYRVRDLTIIRGDIRIYLTDGYLIFSKPVSGRRIAAVFTADVEGGDAEVILMPPSKGERRSLASFVGAPNLNEHFHSAVFLATGDLHADLVAQMSDNPANRKVPEISPLLDDRWGPVLRNLAASYESRLVFDLLSNSAPNQCLFAALLAGVKLGNFDVVLDPRSVERVSVGQVATRDNRTFFDTWTSFEPRRQPRTAPVFGEEAALSDYRIDSVISPDLDMNVVTRFKIRPVQDGLRVFPLDIARNMRVESATVDGQPAEVLQRDALRANLSRAGNELILVAPPQPLRAGRTYEVEFRHGGRVIHDAGDKVYYVSARGNWYPTSGLQYATFDLKFRYPREFDLVSAGEVVEDTTDGPWRTTRRRTSTPIRMAGFNLGHYQHARVSRGGYVVEVYANRSLERALQPKPRDVITPPPAISRRAQNQVPQFPLPETPPSPTAHLQSLATEVADALQFMASKFGPPALPMLTVSPLPGTFGQGFPGLIYLSTLSYLNLEATSRPQLSAHQLLFYGEILQAHETAHQWWGNVVNAAGYHDYWLMEALANYSALLYLEKRKGVRSLEQALEQYRAELLARNESGATVDEAGPIVLGTRLESSLEPRGWRAITYGKGSWIMHMLRRLTGEEKFFALLAELRRRYEHKQVGTEEFRELAARYLPPKSDDPKLDAFFDQWIYGTGIPALKLHYSVKGLTVSGTVSQSEVGSDFSVTVPVEVQFGRGKNLVHWVRTSSEPAPFRIAVKQAPLKVTLDPHYSVLRHP